MTKKQGILSFSGQFLWERKSLYISYISLCIMFFITFYLYELPLVAFYDGLLFSSFLLCCFSLLDYRKVYLATKQLQFLDKQESFSSHYVGYLQEPQTQLARAYQRLFFQAIAEKETVAALSEEQNQQLLDYYSLWTHQIKTPLAALDLLIQTQGKPSQEMKKELVKIENYLEMMLHYLKMKHLEKDLIVKEVSLRSVVMTVIRKYRLFFISKDLSVEVEEFDQVLVTDEKWLRFILEQIIFNSIKYTNHGGVTLSMKGEQLQIADTGIGILAQDLPRVFEQGYTGYNGRENQKASGLGLHMSQEIGRDLGIKFSIVSEVGQGTTVSLTFQQLSKK